MIQDGVIELFKEEMKEYGSSLLLGYIELKPTEYYDALRTLKKILHNSPSVNNELKDLVIVLSLVNFGIYEYKSNFWDELSQILDCDKTELVNECKPILERFCRENNLYFHQGEKNKGYVTTILTHSIMPNVYIDKFISFLFDIYIKELEENYIEEEIEKLLDIFLKKFKSCLDEEDVVFDVQGKKISIYQNELPKSFRLGYIYSQELVRPIIKQVFYYIHQENYSLYDSNNTHFEGYKRFIDCIQKNKEEFNTKKEELKEKRLKKSGYVKRFSIAKYLLEDNDLYLYIPKQHIETEFSNDIINLDIYDDLELIEQVNLDLGEGRFILKTEPEKIRLNKFPKNIRYTITTKFSNNVLYDSEDKLFKEYIFFNENGEEDKVFEKNSFFRVLLPINSEVNFQSILYRNDIVIKDYKFIDIMTTDETIVTINNKMISTALSLGKSTINKNDMLEWACIRYQEKEYKILKSAPEIFIRVSCEKSIEDYIIMIDNKNYELNSICVYNDPTDIMDGSGDKIYGLLIMEEFKLKPKNIVIREKGKPDKHLINEHIIVIDDLSIEFYKDYYQRSDKDCNICINSESLGMISSKFLEKLTSSDLMAIDITVFDDVTCELIIRLPLLKWHIGWGSKYSKEIIWYKDLENSDKNLYFKIINIKNIEFYLKRKSDETKLKFTQQGDYLSVNISKAFDETTNKDHVEILVKVNKDNPIKLTTIYFKETIINCSINYIQSQLIGSWTYIGESDGYNLLICHNKQKVKQYLIKNKSEISDKDILLKDGVYTIIFYRKSTDDFFGESSNDNILIYHNEFCLGDPVLIKCRDKILKARQCRTTENKVIKTNNFYIEKICLIKENLYEGKAFFINTKTGRRESFFQNPFKLTLIRNPHNNYIDFDIEDKDEEAVIIDPTSGFVNPKDDAGCKNIEEITFEIEESLR